LALLHGLCGQASKQKGYPIMQVGIQYLWKWFAEGGEEARVGCVVCCNVEMEAKKGKKRETVTVEMDFANGTNSFELS